MEICKKILPRPIFICQWIVGIKLTDAVGYAGENCFNTSNEWAGLQKQANPFKSAFEFCGGECRNIQDYLRSMSASLLRSARILFISSMNSELVLTASMDARDLLKESVSVVACCNASSK